jgi:hypothetical protein
MKALFTPDKYSKGIYYWASIEKAEIASSAAC